MAYFPMFVDLTDRKCIINQYMGNIREEIKDRFSEEESSERRPLRL